MTGLLTVGMLQLLAVISPGPDFILFTRNAISYQRTAALYTAMGISLGVLIHVLYNVIGLAVIIAQSVLLFNIIKTAGALYLIFLGITALLSKKPKANKNSQNQKPSNMISSRTAFKQGLLCNVLNPKACFFILSVFTLVVTPETSLLTQIGYGLEMTLITFLWFGGLALILTRPLIAHAFKKVQAKITKLLGALLTLLGLQLLFFTQK